MASLIDSIGRQSPNDFIAAVAAGYIPGWRRFRKFGMNNDIDGGPEEVWPLGTIKALPTSAAVASAVSDSAEDDPDEATPPGTGTWTLTIEGLDANFDEVSETVTMAGTTPVETTQTFIRVHRAYSTTSGTNGNNVGNITISVSGVAQAYIEASEGQTHQMSYTVPAGHTWIVDRYAFSVGRLASDTMQVAAYIRLNAGENDESWRAISDIYSGDGAVWANDKSATVLPAKTDVRVLVTTSGLNRAVSVVADGYLVNNNNLVL